MFDHLLDHLPYEDRITFERQGEGTVDENGVYTPSLSTILTSNCDVQEDRRLTYRDREGDVHTEADATVYFPRQTQLRLLKTDDHAVVAQGSQLREARVVEVDLFNEVCLIAWL